MAICPVRVGARGEELRRAKSAAGAAAKDTTTGHSGLETRSLPWRWVAPWMCGTQLGEGEKRRLDAPPFRLADCQGAGMRSAQLHCLGVATVVLWYPLCTFLCWTVLLSHLTWGSLPARRAH